MSPFTFTLRIEAIDDQQLTCHVFNTTDENSLVYYPDDSSVSFSRDNQLALGILANRHQLQKILRSAINGKLHVGQTISCVFIEGFYFLKEDDFNHFIRMDRHDGTLDITVSDNGLHEVHKIFADGSSNPDTKQAGYAGFIEAPDKTRIHYQKSVTDGSSNLVELLAVVEGLHHR